MKTLYLTILLLFGILTAYSQQERYIPKIRTDELTVGSTVMSTTTVGQQIRDSAVVIETGEGYAIVVISANGDTVYRATLGTGLTLTNRTLTGLDTTSLSNRIDEKVDTSWFVFPFGAGFGLDGDTTAITTSAKYGAFYNERDTLVCTKLRVSMVHGIGTDTVNVQITWDDSLNGTGTNLNTNSLPCNSITTGTTDTSFDNDKIPPGVWVWAHTPQVVTGRKPKMLIINLTGWRKKP